MPFEFRDSLSGATQSLSSSLGKPVSVYVCGPTVYHSTHVGHARTYLYFDLVRRYFRESKTPVRHVMNITDIEDKIWQRAAALKISWRTLARREELAFHADLTALGILRPEVMPRASDFVPRMIEIIRALERTGRVRRQENQWMYAPAADHAPRNFPVGSELARHAVLEPGQPLPNNSGAAPEFMVWQLQTRPLPSWPSPWGPGVPGWHLECYVMAQKYLGIPVDLHGGGFDLIYPHHYSENEIALTLEDGAFSRGFLHTGFVMGNGRKMSKSTGNLVPLRTALAEVGSSALRWYLLSRPYNERLDWNANELVVASREFELLSQRCQESLPLGAGGSLSLEKLRATRRDVVASMGDGMKADRAFDQLRGWAELVGRSANGRFPKGSLKEARVEYRALERVTGLSLV